MTPTSSEVQGNPCFLPCGSLLLHLMLPSLLEMNILPILTGLSFRLSNRALFAAHREFDSQVGSEEAGFFLTLRLSHPSALFLDAAKEEAAPNLRHGII